MKGPAQDLIVYIKGPTKELIVDDGLHPLPPSVWGGPFLKKKNVLTDSYGMLMGPYGIQAKSNFANRDTNLYSNSPLNLDQLSI